MSGEFGPAAADWQILVCSVWTRTRWLEQLLHHLSSQAVDYDGRVQVLVDRDNGDATVGTKRTRLLEHATADYVSYVDDDDWVADDYVHRIMLALDESPDVVGFRLAYTVDGVLDRLPAIHSLRYASWRVTDQAYERTPNHLNPVRRQYARLTLPFQDGFGEDRAYSERLLPHLRREVFLDGDPAYLYRYSPATSLFAGGRRAAIGDEPALVVPAHVRLLHEDSPVHGV